MEATIERKQTAFRLSKDLIERLKQLAKQENKSLNSIVERALIEVAYHTPNAETVAAIEEAESGKELDTLDLDNLKGYIASL